MRFFFKEKRLGKAEIRRYDLPLNKGTGAGFLMLLIGLMTFLAALALSASFALSAMTQRWSSGLENKATIEISAQGPDGKIIPPEQVKEYATKIDMAVKSHPAIKNSHVLSDGELQDLVKPWLGNDLLLDKVPLPALISVDLENSSPEALKSLARIIKDIAPNAQLDTHESWLRDLLRFTGALQFAAFLLTIVIGLTATTAVAGAVRARLAVHSTDVELLHLMGAADSYIARQFQRHSMLLAIKGALAGLLAASIVLLIIGWASGRMDVNLLPDFHLQLSQVMTLAILPVFAAILAIAAANRTVLKTLSRMP